MPRRGGFRLVVDSLYHAKADDVSLSMGFTPDFIASVLRDIYRAGHPRSATDLSPELFRAISEVVNKAVAEGLSSSGGVSMPAVDPDNDFLHALRHSADVFSAFKVHRMQRDMGALLTDSNGLLKPFKQWANDVLPIASHQCGAWLRTEYDTAVLRAHQAADWQQFFREADVLPNLKWVPSTSPNPGADHQVFWNTVRPISDPFWSEHRPGDRWNCKCSLTSTDEPATAAPHSDKASEPQPGLSSNPGTDRTVFSQDHPYFPKSCASCSFYKPNFKNRLRHLFQARAKDCYNCPYINGCIPGEKKVKVERELQAKAAANIKQLKNQIDPFNGEHIENDDFVSGSLIILRRSLQDVYEHSKEDFTLMKWLKSFKLENIKDWKYEGWAENRPYSPDNPRYDSKNPLKKKHPETDYFLYYSLMINGEKYWANVKMHNHYHAEVLYTIEREKPTDLIKGKK